MAALASYADARRAGGEWLVRIEDLDPPRVRQGAAAAMLRDLERLGFTWDGPVWRQAMRSEAYREAFEMLRTAELAYPCCCTRRELAMAPRNAQGEPVYPGTCRNDPARASAASRPVSWRVRVPSATMLVSDRHYGRQRQDLAAETGDFAVVRGDGVFAYHLAVVVDDAAQGITDVVRGADLLSSTPRQVWLQQALHLPTPRYLHVPIAIDSAGAKLSKHLGARPLPEHPLEALIGAWRFLGQTEPGDAVASLDDFWTFARANWTPERLPTTRSLQAPPFALRREPLRVR